MIMTQFVPARPAWPRNLGRAMRDAAAAVALGVVIGLAYARISEWPADLTRGGPAPRQFTVAGADPGGDSAVPTLDGTVCPFSSPAAQAAPWPGCRQRTQ